MAETQFTIRNYQAFMIRLDPTEVRGEGSSARPILRLPLQLQIQPTKGEHGDTNYTLLRLAGTLSSPPIGQFAEFEVGPVVEDSRAAAYYRQLHATVVLDPARVRQFEDSRSGANAHLVVDFSALIWFPEDQKFERVYSDRPLQMFVPRSHWADDVLSRWGLSSVKVVEIRFPSGEAGEGFRSAYARVEGAEKLFANGLYRQVLTEIRLGFEALARSQDFDKAGKEFFDHLLQDFHPAKREKATQALLHLYRFLHLGPHEPAESVESPDQPTVSRRDARFALTMAHVVFEYITPQA